MKIHSVLCAEHDGSRIAAETKLEHLKDNITAVYISGKSEFILDGNCGAIANICIEPCGINGFMAVQRDNECWCRPVFGKAGDLVPEQTQTLVYSLKDGRFIVMLPVVSEKYKCTLFSDKDNGMLCAKLTSQSDKQKSIDALALVYAVCRDPFAAIDNCYKQAVSALGNGVEMRVNRKYPEILEYLGWCSWDAFEIRVNHDGLLEKCKEFKEKNIPVRWAILDDMWAEVTNFRTKTYRDRGEMFHLMHSSPLYSFEAAHDRFPDGLKKTITDMKKYVSWVGMWHPVNGYWAGIDPEGPLFEHFKDILYKTPEGKYVAYPEYEKFYEFFGAFHSYLSSCGADFVKVDNQSTIRRFYENIRTVGEIASDMHRALEDSVEKYFGGVMINCMGCANENVWKRPKSSVSRCSNDFQPESREWFTHHILQCAFVSFFQGPLIGCDWDMWWTDDGQAEKNSLLRAISGGPVYVSDKVGRSNPEVLYPLILSDGRILRCSRPVLPTADCLTEDPAVNGKIFKVQNMCKTSGAIAAFNIDSDSRSVSGSVSPDDIPGLEGDSFAVYEFFAHKFYVMHKGERKKVSLENNDDFRLYTFTPIRDSFAAIGRTDKYMSPLTVKKADRNGIELVEPGKYAYFKDGEFFERS